MRDPDPANPKGARTRARRSLRTALGPRRSLRAALGLAAACAFLLVPSSALAGSASVSGSTLSIIGGPERNSVVVRWEDGYWEVEDEMPVSAGAGCESEGSRRAACPASIDRIVVSAGDGDDRVTNWSFVSASISGGAGNDTLYGGANADTLDGGPGTDNLYGSYGDDSLDGGLGADRLSGASGHDTVTYSSRTGGVRVDPDDSSDDGEPGESDDVRKDVEHALLGSGDDLYVGSSSANRVNGGAGNDVLYGANGDDELDGGDGTDSYFGSDGADTMRSQDGLAEDVWCGADEDTAFVDAADRPANCEQVDTATPEPSSEPSPLPAPGDGTAPVDGSALLEGLQLVEPDEPVAITPRGDLTLAVECLADTLGGCRGTITVTVAGEKDASASRRGRGRRRRVGRRTFRVNPGHEVNVSVRISRRGHRVIARKRRTRLRARIDTQTASGPVTTSTTLPVRASRRGGRRVAPPRKKAKRRR